MGGFQPVGRRPSNKHGDKASQQQTSRRLTAPAYSANKNPFEEQRRSFFIRRESTCLRQLLSYSEEKTRVALHDASPSISSRLLHHLWRSRGQVAAADLGETTKPQHVLSARQSLCVCLRAQREGFK